MTDERKRYDKMKENDTITEVRAAAPSSETKLTDEGYYYVAPGSSVTLVGFGVSGRYWWMGGDNPYVVTCRVVSGEFGGTDACTTFTALDLCTGGYLFVQGPHRVLKSCENSIVEVRPIKGRQLEPKYSYGITKMLHAPGSVAVVDGDISMFDSYGTFSVVDSKVGGCRLYGHVSDSYDAAAPDTPVQPGEVAKGYKEFVKSRERSNSLAGYEGWHPVSVDVSGLGDAVATFDVDSDAPAMDGGSKASVRVSKNGSALDVTVSLPDRFAHREYADIVLEGVYSICRKLEEMRKGTGNGADD